MNYARASMYFSKWGFEEDGSRPAERELQTSRRRTQCAESIE